MTREYRQSRKTGPTTSRSEAAANRHLQLVGGDFVPGRGKTLTEKMAQVLDDALIARGKKQQDYEHAKDQLPDGQDDLPSTAEDEHLDWMCESEGFVKGCLKMLSIMRSTTPRKELERARIRIQYGEEGK